VDEVVEVCDHEDTPGMDLLEIVLVHDGGDAASARAMERAAHRHDRVMIVWLSRNYGQHAATLAGCSSTAGDWIVTMDEDGLHDPQSIVQMRAAAAAQATNVIYAGQSDPPHQPWRTLTSKGAKWLVRALFGVRGAEDFSSFRLVEGHTMRALAAYCGPGVYLDVAMQWVFPDAGRVDVALRPELRDQSGYRLRTLLSHFRRMALTAGTRPLRIASAIGFTVATVGLLAALVLVIGRLTGLIPVVQGWTSVMVTLSILLGAILLVLGIVSEYLSMALTAVSGRPPYLIATAPPPEPGPDRESV